MSDTLPRSWSPGLKLAAILLWWGVLFHGVDHLFRGLSDLPTSVLVFGIVQAVLVNIALFALLLEKPYAVWFALASGVVTIVGALAAHLTPERGFFSDSFVNAPHHADVHWWSWAIVIYTVLSALLLTRIAWDDRNDFSTQR